MSLQDLYDLVPIDEAHDEGGTSYATTPIPLDHATAMATPNGATPAATVGMAPTEHEVPPSLIEPYSYLASRGTNLSVHHLDPVFASRLSRALADAEAATGQRAVLRDLYRPPERQAQYYANYTQRPVVYGGHAYLPGERGGLAAPPGASRHGQGRAADIAHGPVLEHLHRNADSYGLEFLSGKAYKADPVHIQLARNSATGTYGTAPMDDRARSGPDDSYDSSPIETPQHEPATRLIPQEQDYNADLLDELKFQELVNSAPKRQIVPTTPYPASQMSLTQTGAMLDPQVLSNIDNQDVPTYAQVPSSMSPANSAWEGMKAAWEQFPPGWYNVLPDSALTDNDKAFLQAHPLVGNNIKNLVNTLGFPFAVGSHLFNGILEGGRAFALAEARRLGMDDMQAHKLVDDLTGMVQYEVMKPESSGPLLKEEPVQGTGIWIKGGQEASVAAMGQMLEYMRGNEVGGGGRIRKPPPALPPETQAWIDSRSGATPTPPGEEEYQLTQFGSNPGGALANTPSISNIADWEARLRNMMLSDEAPASGVTTDPADMQTRMLAALRGKNTNYQGSAIGTPLQATTPQAVGIGHNSGNTTPMGPPPSLTQTPVPPIGGGGGASIPPVSPIPAATLYSRPFNLMDYIRTADDQNAGLIRYARGIGMVPSAVANLRDSFRVTTGATSQTLADSAARLGRAEAPNFVFRVRTPLPEIKAWAYEHPGFNDYLNMFDTLDEIRNAMNTNANLPNPQPGPITVRGIDLPTARTAIMQWERANPQFVLARDRFRENVHEAWRFAAQGEYAVISPQEHARLLAENPNQVYWPNRVTDPTRTNVPRADPSDMAGYRTTQLVRRRLNNEAVGAYVDEVRSLPSGNRIFRRVSTAEINRNKDWRQRVVTFYRHGSLEHYLAESRTVADLLKMDPYFFPSGVGDEFLGATKRLFQSATTGALAPFFSVRDMFRNYVIANLTIAGANAGRGLRFLNPFDQTVMRPPGMLGLRQAATFQGWPLGSGTLPYAIASQILPQLAKHVSLTLEGRGGNWLRAMGVNTDPLTQALASSYLRSTFAQIEAMGSHSGSYFGHSAESTTAAQTRLSQTIQVLMHSPGMRDAAALLNGYKNLLAAVHNANQFAFIQGNRGKASLTRLAAEARELTGNPLTAGRNYTPSGRAIKFDTSKSGIVERTLAPLAHGYMLANELGRKYVPWYNMTQQGMKRFGQAFMQNPTEFSARMFLYFILPSAAAYYWNAMLGKDPNGVDYTDHMMNRRSEYNKSMFFYLGVPGRPVGDGIEFPSFQEGVLPKRMTEDAMHHFYGNNTGAYAEDFKHALGSAVDVALIPPTPPFIQTTAAMLGRTPPQNILSFPAIQKFTGLEGVPGIGGESYQVKDNPYDPDRTMSATIENTLRAIAPSIADMTGAGMAAWGHTPKEMGMFMKANNFFKQAGRRLVEKTDVLRDLANLHAPMSGNTRSTSQMFERQKSIEDLDRFYKKFDTDGTLAPRPISPSGRALAEQAGTEFPPPSSPGLPMPAPTNPLWVEFAESLYNRTKHDPVMGFRSMWQAYHLWSEGVRQLRNIDYGNAVTWAARVQKMPDLMRFLGNNNVDPNSPIAVRNLYERKRFETTKIINTAINAVEYEMSQKYGRPIKITDLDPYNAPSLTQTVAPDEGLPLGSAYP